jgi:pimeloyl-ACP methyl ester carboxylesterase
MPSLAQKHTLIVPDLRGMGDSDKPVSGYDAQNVAKDISDLMRSLGHARYSVAGHDIGANPAYALARAHPDRVRRLAIIEGCHPASRHLRHQLRNRVKRRLPTGT